jgi:SAM-dependent methyltransferase
MFAAALAEIDNSGRTVGVDPSPAMLVEAQRFNSHPRVRYVAGDAAALPIADGCFDLALLSRVIHHLLDRQRCAVELRRVLRPGGVVVVRTTVRERLDAIVYDYWPRLREIDQARFPSADTIVADFEAAGFTPTTVDSVAQPVQPHLRAYHDALASRPQSKFETLATDEFATGLARLRQDAEAETDPHEISERYDVLVFAAR